MKRLETITDKKSGRETRVYRDSIWQEWRVKHYQHGEHLAAADYHTDDKAEAQHHARAWTWQANLAARVAQIAAEQATVKATT